MIRRTILFLAVVLLPVVAALGRRESCTSDDQCDGALSCVGNEGNMKCFMKKGRGMRCGREPFWVCEDGLECEDEICKVAVAGECTQPRSVCVDGLSCVGNDELKKCFVPKREGMPCGLDPFWVCREDLVCEDRVCKTSVASECNAPEAVCVEGARCVGKVGRKRCVTPMDVGGKCGVDPKWFCADGLVCVDNVCRKLVGRNKRCGARRVCKERFVCAGERRNTRCVVPGRPGRMCGMFDTCRDSTCVDGRCVV